MKKINRKCSKCQHFNVCKFVKAAEDTLRNVIPNKILRPLQYEKEGKKQIDTLNKEISQLCIEFKYSNDKK